MACCACPHKQLPQSNGSTVALEPCRQPHHNQYTVALTVLSSPQRQLQPQSTLVNSLPTGLLATLNSTLQWPNTQRSRFALTAPAQLPHTTWPQGDRVYDVSLMSSDSPPPPTTVAVAATAAAGDGVTAEHTCSQHRQASMSDYYDTDAAASTPSTFTSSTDHSHCAITAIAASS